MKTFTYKAFCWIFEITFVIFIISISAFIIFQAYEFFHNGSKASYSIGLNDPYTLNEFSYEKVAIPANTDKLTDVFLVATKWQLNFKPKDNAIKYVITAFTLLYCVYIFIMLVILRKFVFSLRNSLPFNAQNVKRLKILGLLVLFMEPLNWVFNYFGRQWISYYLPIGHEFDHRPIVYGIGFNIGSLGLFAWNWILCGLMILVIAEVFKQGLKMKEEQDLTI